MRDKLHQLYPNYRTVVFRVLGRLHGTLLVAICCATLFAMLQQKDIAAELQTLLPHLASISPQRAFWQGLLFALPLSLSFYAARGCKKIWQFVLCAVALCALSWLLMGHPVGAILLAVFCFFRARRRLLEEPGESALDVPSLWGLLAFVLSFFISSFMAQPVLQRLAVGSAVVYLLAFLGYHGLARLDEYLRLNDSMYALPTVRIQRIAGGALAAAMLLAAVLLLPPALRFQGDVTLDPSFERENVTLSVQYQPESTGNQQALAELFEDELGDYSNPLFTISPVVSYIVYALIITGIAALVLYGLYRLLRGAGRSFTDRRDTVQYLDSAHEDHDLGASVKAERAPLLDRSPNARVRRRYRKVIARAFGEPPKASLTPAELEAQAELSIPALHSLYERARYAQHPLTNDDLRSLK